MLAPLLVVIHEVTHSIEFEIQLFHLSDEVIEYLLFIFQFRYLVDHINGEESNKFTNILGESVVVTIQESEDATSELLCLLSLCFHVVYCLLL